MADQHDRAFKFIERHGQRLAGGQIQVVGGFVHQQEVGPLPDDHAQYQPRLLAPAHAAHGLLDHVAAEIESAQKAAQILLARGLALDLALHCQLAHQADHVLQRRVRRAQHIELLLREIANVQTASLGDLAAQRLQVARDGFHDR